MGQISSSVGKSFQKAFEINVESRFDGKRLGEMLKVLGYSHRLVTRLKRTEGGMTRNGCLIRTVDIVHTGEVIRLCEHDEPQKNNDYSDVKTPPNPNLKADILYEDEDVVVFDKPQGMPVHQSIKHRDDTLANLFAYLYPDKVFRPVNRLDRDTCGCVVVAKNQRAAHLLQRSVDKVYVGVIKNPHLSGGRICKPIAREQESIIKRCVRSDGQYAATCWRVIERRGEYALCEFILETGRTHQIRVHMASIGYPLVGDGMYGGCCDGEGQRLCCQSISFQCTMHNSQCTIKVFANAHGF